MIMKHKFLLLALVFIQLPLFAQNDTVRIFRAAQTPERTEVKEQSFATKETAEMKKKPDSLVRVEVTTIKYFTDTLTSIAQTPDSVLKQREEVVPTDSTDRRGHYIEAHVGAGFGSLGYVLAGPNNRVDGFVSAIVQLQYAYFFHPNVGVGVGAWFTNYTSFAHWGGEYYWEGQTDTDNEPGYNHTARVDSWREREILHNVGVPISLQFQYKKPNAKAGFFAAVGVAPSFSVMKTYKVLDGDIRHSGYYPWANLTLDDMHEFSQIHYEAEPCGNEAIKHEPKQGNLEVGIQAACFADLGVLITLTPQVDLFIGAYGNISANDANKSEKRDLGWKNEIFTFMNEYNGAYATTAASASRPWEAGLKIGIHWRHIKPDKHEMVDYFEHFTRIDTLVDLKHRQDTLLSERIDTLTRAHIAKAAEEVEKLNKIYFDFDSYKLSPQSQQYLASIVGILNRVPDAKIAIDGHASEEGQRKHNEKLAYNRVKAVAQFLVSKGINKKRVIVIGHGSLIPNEENVNHELPLDRRAEVKIVQKQSDLKK